MIVETAKANESNQTKINLNLTENALTAINQAATCSAGEIIPKALIEEADKDDVAKVEKKEIIETKIVPKNSNLPEGKFIINASAYTASADECGKSDGITASGVKVRENETIACPKSFAFGTKINIEGRGTYICQDRGGAIKGNKIDIYVKTKTEAFAFGRQNLVAEIITE